MNRKLIGGVAALLVVAVGIWLFWLRDRGEPKDKVATTPRSAEVKPTTTPAKTETAEAPRGMATKWSLDVDVDGPLSLEGQVVGLDGKGVGGATVWLSSVPPRSIKAEDDGTFTFEKLVGRTYVLTASSGDLISAPATYKLTATSDPLKISLAEGAIVEVAVIEGGPERTPIAGADVKSGEEQSAKTDATGKATIKPVRPGWVSVRASAPGYEANSSFTTIGSAGATGQITITLRKGFAVSGRVVDEANKPIAKARVTPTGGMWDVGSKDDGVVTDDKGQFTLPALAAGSHTLVASDTEHAPTRSAPVTVSDRPVSGIVITMKAGAVLAGTVVDTKGAVVPFATVQLAGKGQEGWRSVGRQTTTDKEGAFELRGLARSKFQVRAEAEVVASKLVDVDLVDKPAIKDLKLVLDVAGKITGIVVDDKGTPVAEVQVNAFPDILGGASTEGLALAGMTSATTDGGGAFVITGLPDGGYRLWAARAGAGDFQEWGQHGTAAKTGDSGIKIVLPTPGELVGTIVIEGASAPNMASVAVGQQAPTPASKGAFVIKNVEPGKHDVSFRGPEFAEMIKHDVVIEPGKKTDLGTVTVFRGRKVTGKVVDRGGSPVSGAKVRVGEMLFTGEDNRDDMTNIEEMYGIRSAVSDQAGEFTIIGIPKKSVTVMADHPDRGRSTGIVLPDSGDDPPRQTLTLRGYGSIVGKVTMKGKPQGGVTVSQSTKGGGAAASFAPTDDEGNFTMARVPEGPIVLQAMKQGMMTMKSTTANVTVTAGKQSTVTIDIPVGELALTVQIKPQANATVDAAQVFLFTGLVAVANAKQLTEGFFQGGAQGMKFWLGKAMPMPEFDELVAGDYSVCSIPITGKLEDPTFQGRLQENMQLLKVYCRQVKVTPSPVKQTFLHELPSMTPLPTPPAN